MKTTYHFLLAFLCLATVASAQQAGTLDPSFANGGKLIVSINPGSDKAQCIGQLTDGSFLVGGTTYNAITGNDFFCIKVDSNGALVTSFGTGGKISVDIQTGSDDRAYSIAVDNTTGKFILAGSSDNSIKQSAVLMRFNANGSIDSTFGVNGKTLTSLTTPTSNKDEFAKIRINYLTGKIIAAGRSSVSSAIQRPMVARYNSNGTLDTSFNHSGLRSLWVMYSDSTATFTVRDLVVTPAGTITMVGSKNYGGWSARINGNGTLDPTYSTDGVMTCNYMSHLNAMYIDPSTNYIYTTGDERDYFTNNGLIYWTGIKRILPNGVEDTWAGGGGNYCYFSDIYGDECTSHAMAALSDGTYVIAGTSYYGTTNTEILMMRMLSTGYIDYTFAPAAAQGRVSDDYGASQAEIFDLVLQSNDEKIVTAGYAGNDLFVSRYFGKTVPQIDSFHLLSPADQSTHLITTDIDMVWSPALGAAGYELQFDTTAAFGAGTRIENYGTDTSTDRFHYPLYLEVNHTYWWRVRCTDGVHTSQWKGPWKFTTVPDRIQLVSPANHATGVSQNPTLDWTDIPVSITSTEALATGFDLQIDTLSNLSTPGNIFTVCFGTVPSQYQITQNLTYGGTYYWRIRSNRLGKPGPWSDKWDFNVRFATGIQTVNNDEGISVYPNPATSDITLLHATAQEILTAEASDALGRSVLLSATAADHYDVSALAKGVYNLKITTRQGTVVARFIKE